MRKITTIFLFVSIMLMACTVSEAKTSPRKSRQHVSQSKGKTGNTNTVKYAIYEMPLDESQLTLETFDLLPGSNVKSVEIQSECRNSKIDFNERGQVTSYLNWSECTSASASLERYVYNDNGELIAYIIEKTSDFRDEENGSIWDFGPVYKQTYVYERENGKVVEIAEAILIDGGLNYAGQTHMKFIYDKSGNLSEAICKENPAVKFEFVDKKKVSYTSSYYPDYDTRSFLKLMRATGNNPKLSNLEIGDIEVPYNTQYKIPIKWTHFDDYEELELYDEPYEREEELPTAKDSKGNWTEKNGDVRTIIYY